MKTARRPRREQFLPSLVESVLSSAQKRMNYSKKLALGLAVVCCSLAVTLHAETNLPAAPQELNPGPDDARIAATCALMLERWHISKHAFDNDYSGRLLDHYIKSLDPRHIHFLQTDLDKFELWRNKLDDLTLRHGDTLPAYDIFNTFRMRQRQKTEYVLELLKTEKFTFDGDDRVLLSRKDKPAPKTLDEAKQLWREQLRFEFLQEKLARATDKKKKDVKKPEPNQAAPKPRTDTYDALSITLVKTAPLPIPEALAKRYKRTLHIYDEMDNGDVFEIYLTTLAHVYDPHSDYFGKQALEQFKISMSLALFGIGAQLQMDEDGYCNKQVLYRRLAQIVVNAKDLFLTEDRAHRVVDGAVGCQVVPQGFFKHHTGVGRVQPRYRQLLTHGGKQRRRSSDIHDHRVGLAGLEQGAQRGIVIGFGQVHAHKFQQRCKPGELLARGALGQIHRVKARLNSGPVFVRGQSLATHANDASPLRQSTVTQGLKQRGHQLAPGQVARAAKKNQVEAHRV